MKAAYDRNEKVHLVTQLVTSLLGLIILPKEQYFKENFLSVNLEDLYSEGWPQWDIQIDKPPKNRSKTKRLRELITHIRNSSAHGHITFDDQPESPHLHEVKIVMEDGPQSDPWKPDWRTEIRGHELYKFCILFSEYIEESVEP